MRVMCISSGLCEHGDVEVPGQDLVVGQVYEIIGIEVYDDGQPDGYDLAEFGYNPDYVWCACHFKDIDEDNEKILRLIKIKEDA